MRCSFCGKSQHAVQKLIAGPDVYICDECVDMSNEILEEDLPAWHWRNELAGVPKSRQAPPEGQDAGLRVTEVVASPPPGTDEELDRLWHALKVKGQASARGALINHYAPLVLHAVDALGPIQRAEFISYGFFGLIDSITKFEPGSGDSFDTFARPRILEAILEELRLIAESDTLSSD